jgi:hypothetical protein
MHYELKMNSTMAVCAEPGEAALGLFDVICQTTGDEVFGMNTWDVLIPQNGEPTAFASSAGY